MRKFPRTGLLLGCALLWAALPRPASAQGNAGGKKPSFFGTTEPVPEGWAVAGAPCRAMVRVQSPPNDPDAGVQINVPDLGLTTGTKAGAYYLTDEKGNPLPVATVWEAEGQDAILLANGLQPDKDYFLYVGGSAKPAPWTPKTSLLLETRALAPGRSAFTSNGAIEDAWRGAAVATQGAKFVGEIFSGGNPFGEQTNFLSHYIGYFKPQSETVELYTSSSDASFVMVDGRPFLDWPGNHSANATLKTLRTKKLPPSSAPVRIDYYQAKNAEGDPAMCLGWLKGGKGETIPADAWLHPGTSKIERFEEVKGRPVPATELALHSYLGFGGTTLFELRGRLLATDLKSAPVEWRFDDGGVITGPECTRILSAMPAVQHVTVRVGSGADALQSTRRLSLVGQNPPETAEGEKGHRRYVELLGQLDAAKLSAAMAAAALPVLIDVGTDEQIAPWASAWLHGNPAPTDLRWLPAQLARLRALAQTDPQGALAAVAALRNDGAVRQLYGPALDLCEIDLRLYYVRDGAAAGRIQQLGFGQGDTPKSRLAAIRLGDYYRLTGDVRQATARYLAAQPPDPSNGRRLPAEDQANSLTVKDLIESRNRQEADAKLTEWELAHPMAKFSTDFLLLRSRVLTLYGRWREALAELEAFAATHLESPYQIEVDFYRARALYELGKKDDARKIWQDIVKQYPRSELATLAKDWLKKS